MLTGKEILTGPPGLSKDGSYIIFALSEVLKQHSLGRLFRISKPDGSKCFLCSSVSLFSAIGNAIFTWKHPHLDIGSICWGKRPAEAHSTSCLSLSPLSASGGFLVTVCCVKRIEFGTLHFTAYVMFNSF